MSQKNNFDYKIRYVLVQLRFSILLYLLEGRLGDNLHPIASEGQALSHNKALFSGLSESRKEGKKWAQCQNFASTQGFVGFNKRINHFGVTALYSLPEGIAGEKGDGSKLNDLYTVNSPVCNQLNQKARSKCLIRVVVDEGLLLVKRISKASRK